MTSSGKIRIYELSKDLSLDNKDVLDAARKLAIAAKSHSSSEAEVIALEATLRMEGIPALILWDEILSVFVKSQSNTKKPPGPVSGKQ